MTCIYCEKPATGLDLCHARHPVCDEHQGLGHQIEILPLSKPAARVLPEKPHAR